MPTPVISFEAYHTTPSWVDMSGNTLVFSGSASAITPLVAREFQDGTHIGSGLPGDDDCSGNHVPNVKWLTDSTMSVNGGGSEALNDTNLADTECTFRIHFYDAAVAWGLSNGRLYIFDGTTVTTPAEGVDAAMYVKGQDDSGNWFHANDYSSLGPSGWTTGGVGGDSSGNRILLPERTAPGSPPTNHYYYCALSAAAEQAGETYSYKVGVYLEYS